MLILSDVAVADAHVGNPLQHLHRMFSPWLKINIWLGKASVMCMAGQPNCSISVYFYVSSIYGLYDISCSIWCYMALCILTYAQPYLNLLDWFYIFKVVVVVHEPNLKKYRLMMTIFLLASVAC